MGVISENFLLEWIWINIAHGPSLTALAHSTAKIRRAVVTFRPKRAIAFNLPL